MGGHENGARTPAQIVILNDTTGESLQITPIIQCSGSENTGSSPERGGREGQSRQPPTPPQTYACLFVNRVFFLEIIIALLRKIGGRYDMRKPEERGRVPTKKEQSSKSGGLKKIVASARKEM
jgi:hypothetical protein